MQLKYLVPSTIFLASSFLVACKSTPNSQGVAVGKNVERAASQLEMGAKELDATVASLKSLVESPAPDLTTQFKTFSTSLGKLEAIEKDLRTSATAMEEKGRQYFTEWNQQIAAIQNEDIRETSTERKEAVDASFTKAREEHRDVREDFDPLLSDLKDIRTTLQADLTVAGLDGLEDAAKDVEKSAPSVSKKLMELAGKYRELGVALSRHGPGAPPAQ